MTNAAVAGDVPQPGDILRDLAAQLPFDVVIAVDDLADPADLVFGQLAGADGPSIPASFRIRGRRIRPIPWIYVSAIHVGLSFGTSTPTIRGIITPVIDRFNFHF